MPKVISSKDFRIKMREAVADLQCEDGYLVVANGKSADGMFVVMSKDKFIDITKRAGLENESAGMTHIYDTLKDVISDKYREMRLKR